MRIGVRSLRSTAVLAGALGACACVALRPAIDYPGTRPHTLEAAAPIAAVGDLQMTAWIVRATTRAERNRDDQARLLADLEARDDALGALALVGDLVYTAWSRRDWAHFDTLMTPFASAMPLLPALGNHDYHCIFIHLCNRRVVPRNVRLRFPWLSPGSAYWVSWGQVALVFLDSETRLDAQAAWLDGLLDEIQTSHAAVVVFAHRPPFTDSTARGLEPAFELRAHVLPVLAETSLVPVLVSGHAHGYEHLLVDGMHFIVTGGGGGPRSPLASERPNDVYPGPDCDADSSGKTLRPFNYLWLEQSARTLDVTVRGLCKGEVEARRLESFSIATGE